jgi:photosystem II stability/assembly factor-like uncharacterized protein
VRSRRIGPLAAFAALALGGRARGNGAFPDGSQILLPADRPGTIVLATNFGLVVSEDAGARWRWACEQGASAGGSLYQLGAPPSGRVFTLGAATLASSDDLGCRWTALADIEDARVLDYFPDPIAGARVLLLRRAAPGAAEALVESLDGGATVGRTLYAAPADRVLTTLEAARADPRIVYLTVAPVGDRAAEIVRTLDGGQRWDRRVPVGLGPGEELGLAAVDPIDPRRLYLRMTSRGTEALGVSEDGGDTLARPLTARGPLTAFVRLQDGTLLAAALEGEAGVLYRSTDGGRSFAPTPATLHVRALAARGERLYAAADNAVDGFALAVSDDRGESWRPVMAFSDVAGIAGCGDLASACAASCEAVVALGVFRASVCQASAAAPEPGAPDAGADAAVDAAVVDAASADRAGKDGGPVRATGSGACAVAGRGAPSLAFVLAAGALGLTGARSRRARRRRGCRAGRR